MEYSNKTLFAYLRVSTKGQEEEGNSLQFQKNIAQRVADKNGFKDIKVFNEGAVSGTTEPMERAVFPELYKEIENDKCKHLFVYEFSRLSRKGFWSEWLRREFLEHDIKIWEGENGKPIDLSNPTDSLISGILNKVYEYERNNLVKRIKSGLEESYEKGKWSGVQVPYGYKRDEDGLVVVDEKQAKVYYRMVNMVHKGKSVTYIANWLNDNNIPTNSVKAVDKGFIEYDKNGQAVKVDTNEMVWRDTVVRHILESELRKGIRRTNGKTYDFPSLLSEEKWDELQKRLEYNKRFSNKGNKAKHFYLLKGLLYCKRHEKHDANLLGKIKSDQRSYYCTRKRKAVRYKDEPPCPLPSPNLDMLNDVVWETFLEVFGNSYLVYEKYKKKMLDKYDVVAESDKLESKISTLRDNIKSLESRKEKLLNLYLEDELEKELFNKKKQSIQDDIEETNRELKQLQGYKSLSEDEPKQVNWMDKFIKELKAWKDDKFSKERKRDLLRTHIEKIFVEYDEESDTYKLDFHFRYPIIDEDVSADPTGFYVEQGTTTKKIEVDKSTYQLQSNRCGSCRGRQHPHAR